jgi:hypothetical protein
VVDVDHFLSVPNRQSERTTAEACLMNQLLARQIAEAVSPSPERICSGLDCEAQLRVAAATLSDAPPGLITATTVVGILGQDDLASVELLVADIADEFGVASRIRVNVGTFSVRFSLIDQKER